MNFGATALMAASQKGHLEVVRLLLEIGVDNGLDRNDGSTALFIASLNGHLEVVRLLLESGPAIRQEQQPDSSHAGI